MILTCPECATRYFVPDDKVGADGRTVKCASCGHRWHAAAEPDLELFDDPEAGAAARDIQAVAEAAVKPSDDLSELAGQDIPKVMRQRKADDRKVREAAAVGVVWAGMAAGLAVLIMLAIVFRVDVVRIWPRSASVYAMSPFKVNQVGLTLEQVRAEPTLQDGHAALAVSGIMRNVEDRTVMAPPLKVVLLSADGHQVGGKVAVAQDPKIPPGETRKFAIVLLDPPSNAHTLEVAFVYDPAKGKAASAPVHVTPSEAGPAADAPLRGSAHSAAPVMAAPAPPPPTVAPVGPAPAATSLSKDSPYALPEKPSHD
ncbi:MAG: hypothetical protein JWP35_2842 [Caulobacter sp.]|nr:hypothetical protein [Caulobacter sp.]